MPVLLQYEPADCVKSPVGQTLTQIYLEPGVTRCLPTLKKAIKDWQ